MYSLTHFFKVSCWSINTKWTLRCTQFPCWPLPRVIFDIYSVLAKTCSANNCEEFPWLRVYMIVSEEDSKVKTVLSFQGTSTRDEAQNKRSLSLSLFWAPPPLPPPPWDTSVFQVTLSMLWRSPYDLSVFLLCSWIYMRYCEAGVWRGAKLWPPFMAQAQTILRRVVEHLR